MTTRFRGLRLVARTIRIIAWLVLGIGVIVAAVLGSGTPFSAPGIGGSMVGLFAGLAMLVGSLALFGVLFAAGALFDLLIRIEADARQLAELIGGPEPGSR